MCGDTVKSTTSDCHVVAWSIPSAGKKDQHEPVLSLTTELLNFKIEKDRGKAPARHRWGRRTYCSLRHQDLADCADHRHQPGGWLGREVKRIAFDHSGTMLAAPCVTGDVLVYDVGQPQAKQVAQLAGHEEDCVFGVAWGVEDPGTDKAKRVLVSASHDATSHVWVEKDKPSK
ncbi:unnamed protein product [Prorocentrum cordatum]|uniref:Uncharacterized protein n=1 Tax=Prorocentrum cordatum TaxID=2364126 RepID=A0ABN9T258_9DINO|nr:unnamed protein product [Polarella glacialis]